MCELLYIYIRDKNTHKYTDLFNMEPHILLVDILYSYIFKSMFFVGFQILFAIQKQEKKSLLTEGTDTIGDRVLLQICSSTRKYPLFLKT